jgi:hypothetical protein
MIVKNEERVLPRCLAAAMPLCDAALICDTGSTDSTVEVARSLGARANVSTALWKNFGHNRTTSVRLAESLVKERGWDARRTYYLFLDADMILCQRPDFDKQALDQPWYLIEQRDAAISYWNTRLGRSDLPWTSVGVTHEYWSPGRGMHAQAKLPSLYIDDKGDGGAKSDKAPRDIALLLQGINDEPDNYRYKYYLAQTYLDVGDLDNAALWFGARIAAGGWEEERWYAKFKLGQTLLRYNQPELIQRGAGVLLEAFAERPTRAEPLYALARFYRERGKNQLAYMLASRAKDITYPKDDSLFVEHKAHGNGPDEEISITGYYVGKREEGLAACRRLIAGADVGAARLAAKNVAFYTGASEPLPAHLRGPEDIVPDAEILMKSALMLGRFQVPEGLLPPQYVPANPSIVPHPKGAGFLVNVRMVNYQQERGRWYVSRDADGTIRTENITCCWDPETGVASEHQVLSWDKSLLDAGGRIEGLEDVRLALHAGRIWCTLTSCQVPGAGGNPRVVLGRLSASLARIDRLLPFKYAGIGTYEKNWLLYPHDDELRVIYGYAPFTVLDVDLGTGNCELLSSEALSDGGDGWRGGAPPIQFGGKTLLVVHQVVRLENRNVYLHRFVEADGARVTRWSRPFCLEGHGIEYVAGAVAHGDRLLLTYGREDKEACWMSLPMSLVLGMLPIPAP